MSAQTSPVVVVAPSGPGLIIRVIWFLFVGWWLGAIVTGLAWFCLITVILLPIGLMLINRLPTVVTLRPQGQSWRLENGVLVQGNRQHPFLLRAIWFVLIGWWLSGLWLSIAYGAVLTVILLPLAFWMFGRAGAVTTLYHS